MQPAWRHRFQVQFLTDDPFPRLCCPRWLRPHIGRFTVFFACIVRLVEIPESVRLWVNDLHVVAVSRIQRVALSRNRESEQCARFSAGIVLTFSIFRMDNRSAGIAVMR